ncbi:MAG: division/cell wall cluster transcriptional repressor MraZ [Ignavibacteriales bacterium CG18_big_fil_WC_8_21_14_2_50_31_20]|nr:MAG: division/cell wall cluster transcriptional repressor MraZ [Ignavibacteriales bacterium CG18_big_fil_WC_8_21_14_2_50_31_20]
MFLGSYNYAIDTKGRISIPAKLRKFVSPEANNTFVLTRGSSKCINIYPMDYWKELVASKLDKLNTFDPKEAKFMRLFLQEATEDTFDTQSRLLVPKKLIDSAEIEKDVIILGMNKYIEVWSPKLYEDYLKEIEEPYENIAKEVMKI